MKNEKFPPKADPPLAEKIKFAFFAIILPFCLLVSKSASAETIWVTDRGAKQLIRVDSQGGKKIIDLKDFASPIIVEVDQRDGSVWVNDMTEPFNNQLVKLSKDGEELFRLKGFVVLGDAAIDPRDGSYYAAERMTGEVVKVSSDGKELFRIKNLSPIEDLEGMGCLKKTEGCHNVYKGMKIVFESIDDIDISPVDSSVWVADTAHKRILKFTKEGVLITGRNGVGEAEHLAAASDGSCWVNNIDEKEGRIFKVSGDGTKILAKIEKLDFPFELSVSPLDNACWLTTRTELLQIAPDGKSVLKRIKGFRHLQGISLVNPRDGSFWVADYFGREIIKFSKDGEIIKRVGGFERPRFLDVFWG